MDKEYTSPKQEQDKERPFSIARVATRGDRQVLI